MTMRLPWPDDHTVTDLFDSPSMGMLWLKDIDMVQLIDDSRQSATDILGTTAKALLTEENDRFYRMLERMM